MVKAMDTQSWRERDESQAEYGVLLASEVMTPLRDGVAMANDIFFPALPDDPTTRVPGEFPVILIRTPYNKRSDNMRLTGEYFARRGYVMVIQDCRGRYDSDGTFVFLTQEAEDGYDAVEWCGTQPWSNGRVGMMGTSYLGWTQMAAAVMNPPHLRTLVINQAGASAYSSSVRHNGTMELRFLAWAFMDAATNPTAVQNPQIAKALGGVQGADWLDRLPWRPGSTPLALNPSVEQWAIDLYTNGDYSSYWDHPGFNFARHWDNHSDIPMLLSGAWYDSYTRATLENYFGLSERKEGPVHLLMGPWTHGSSTVDATFSGDVEFGPTASVAGNLAENFTHLHLQWFDCWLKEMDNGVDRQDRVRLFLMEPGEGKRSHEGRLLRGGRWIGADALPLAGTTETPYYLQPEGGLSTDAPKAPRQSTTWVYDPANPVPTIGGNLSSLANVVQAPPGLEDRIPYEMRWANIVKIGGQHQQPDAKVRGAQPPYMPLSSREDIVVFQTEPLAEDVVAVGPISATLYISSDAPDTDVTVKVVDVFPPSADYPLGYELNISDSIFRMRYRNSWSEPEMMTPGEIYRVEIPMYGTGAVFGAGHRIRVDVSSSNYPRFDRNPNTGDPIGKHHSTRIAVNTIHHDAQHASFITLPVVPAASVAIDG
jgi:putative CocE/NonD family hydrolase